MQHFNYSRATKYPRSEVLVQLLSINFKRVDEEGMVISIVDCNLYKANNSCVRKCLAVFNIHSNPVVSFLHCTIYDRAQLLQIFISLDKIVSISKKFLNWKRF